MGDTGPDLCEKCNTELFGSLSNLFRLQNVSTERVKKISSDEEERQRIGYEIKTAVRFSESQGRLLKRTTEIISQGSNWGTFIYGQSSVLWRINMGWRHRAKKDEYGFTLDVERGLEIKRTMRMLKATTP